MIVEQVNVVDADEHRHRRLIARERVDDLLHPAQRIGSAVACELGECPQRDGPARLGGGDPSSDAVLRSFRDFAGHPTLADPGRTRQHHGA
nr:hypothetical protein [Mycolicibacterium wolinskyi]